MSNQSLVRCALSFRRNVWLKGLVCGVLLLGFFLSTGLAKAQVLYGSLTGNVTDPSKAALPSAHVEALNMKTGVAREATADSSGIYLFRELQPGVYKVTVSAPNFGAKAVENVRVDANTESRVDVELAVATQSSNVTVVDAEPLLQTDRADVHTQLEAAQIENLPITSSEGRSFQSLYRIIPGFTPPTEMNSAAGNPQRSMTSNVNGGSSQGNSTRIDGATDTYTWLPANVAYVPPADAIESVNIVTNSFDAEQGMAGGAAINVITKTGTNEFHGSAHEFHTDQALAAESYFTQVGPFRKPKNILNQFGGTFGGPIKHNKLFFFGDWETTRQRQNATRGFTVANPAAIFDSSGNVNFTGTGTTVYDPNTGNADGTGRTPFPNDTIPANRIDPAALTMLQRVATKGFLNNSGLTATNNYVANNTAQFNRDDFDGKVNYTPTQKLMIFGKYSLSKSFIFDPPALGPAEGDATNGGQLGNAFSRIQSVGIGGSYTINSHMLLDANVGYTRQRINAQSTDLSLGAFGLNTLHIPGTNGPQFLEGGIPAFQISGGFANMGNPNTGNPFLFRDNQYVVDSNLGWTKGRHDLRFGFEYDRSGINHFQPQGGAFQTARGSFRFTGGVTALSGGPKQANSFNSIAQFLLGLPDEVGTAVQNIIPNSLRFKNWDWYARDRWQINSKLTLTYGLRWEYYPFATADHSGARVFDPATGNVIIGGRGGVPTDDGVDVGTGQFDPRIGIAYRITAKTVVRAGYGISSDPNNFRFLRNAFPSVTISDFTGNSVFGKATSGFAPAASLTGETLAPYPGLVAGITPIPLPDISTGMVPLPNNLGTTTVPLKFRRGYFESYNLIVQREFAGFVAEAGYVGTRGVRPLTNMNINAAPISGGNAGRELNAALGHTWSDINSLTPFKNSYYDSLQTKLTRRFGGSSMIGTVYTFSKAEDYEDSEELNFLLFPFPAYWPKNKALAGFDRTHNFALYGAYELPFGRNKRWAKHGFAGAVAGGWQFNWLMSAISGTPVTITGGGPSFNAPGNTETADLVGPVHVNGGIGPRPGQTCFDTNPACDYFTISSFAPVPAGQARFGNTGRNVPYLRGPGIFNLDASIFRNFRLTERLTFQFRTEWFSLTNTPHFSNPTVNNAQTIGQANSNFGEITSTLANNSGARQIWFGGVLTF
jgi:hypothetical protein